MDARTEREQRLAEALRQNLLRRKARARQGEATDAPPPDAGPPPPDER